ncbi:unnamed protein product [Protopolystoma xenopodis]|uniref:C2H2-type domain-containing protein n=1 Tax=Protopolystoma xenopodis TaxID=117903 RepID=A0A448WFY7_9PLAT|nr:unnamed protein product [Protopolystoma xenopodis]
MTYRKGGWVCRANLANQASWRRHGARHARPLGNSSGDSCFPCPVCPADLGRVYSSYVQLNRHFRQVHPTGFLACPHCPRKFARPVKLRQHLDAIHTGLRKFVCTQPGCARAFSRNDKLTEHLRRHVSRFYWNLSPLGFALAFI